MKKSILLMIASAVAMFANAGSVTSQMAQSAANAWVARNRAFKTGGFATGEVRTVTDPANPAQVLWHQVSMQDGGMIVVAPVTEIEPVIMALDNDPGDIPEAHPLRAILMRDVRRRLQFLGIEAKKPSTPSNPRLKSMAAITPVKASVTQEAKDWAEVMNDKWAAILAPQMKSASIVSDDIKVNISTIPGFEKGGVFTHWDQSVRAKQLLYNSQTPHQAVAGCVATATAALAQFFGATNSAEFSAECTYANVPATYATTPGPIDWAILPENFGGTNAAVSADTQLSQEQQELLSRVSYNAGVGVEMNWNMEGKAQSSALEGKMVQALKEVFGFKQARAYNFLSNALGDKPMTADEKSMQKLLYNQVRAGAPVGMGIEKHSVLAVGYGLDDDGVERVRVFMGWGGTGDAWYALPKIETKATVGGSLYLSEIVDEFVTMIAYDNDDVVPVVGHISMPGAQLRIDALDRDFTSNEAGYFGTRVPADFDAQDCVVKSQGREAQFEIGDDVSEEADLEVLLDSLPDAFEFVLLNSSVAYSFETALSMARRERKAVLRVSGKSGDPATDALLNYIFELDEGNINDFTNKFVYVFSDSSSAEGNGGSLSYAVLNPWAAEEQNRWKIDNGALTYGYTIAKLNITSDDYDDVETTNTCVCTFVPQGYEPLHQADPTIDAFDPEETDAISGAVLASFDAVLAEGARRFAEAASGITLKISADSANAEQAIQETALARNDDFKQCDLYTQNFKPGEITLTAYEEVTNNTAGIAYGCSGWTLTNKLTGASQRGTGTTATFTSETNDVWELVWDYSMKVAVKVEVKFTEEVFGADPEAVSPGTGWYPYGVPVLFTAKQSVEAKDGYPWGLVDFNFQNKIAREDSALLAPDKFLVGMMQPGDIWAEYGAGEPRVVVEPIEGVTLFTFRNILMNEDGTLDDTVDLNGEVPNAVVYTQNGETDVTPGAAAEVPAASNAVFVIKIPSFVREDGTKMVFAGFFNGSDVIQDRAAVMDLSDGASCYLTCVWKEDAATPPHTPGDEDVPPSTDIKIEWDSALTVLSDAGYKTNLFSAAQLGKYNITVNNIKVTVPRGFKAVVYTEDDGSVSARLEEDENVLKPLAADGSPSASPLTIYSNGDGTVSVEAKVKNGVRGFWYTLFGTDDLAAADWQPVADGYKEGTPSKQADQIGYEDAPVEVSIIIEPNMTKKFFKLRVTREKPVATN